MSQNFTPNVPLANQSISGTQPIINSNFLCLDNSVNGFTVDHFTMTDTTNGGKHKWVTLQNVASDPTLTYPISRLYEKTFGTNPNFDLELYWATPRQNGNTQINRLIPSIKAMAMWTNTVAPPGPGNQPFVAGALLINTNVVVGSGSPLVNTVTFTTPLDYANYYVFLAAFAGSPNKIIAGSNTVDGFQVAFSGAGVVTGFMVI